MRYFDLIKKSVFLMGICLTIALINNLVVSASFAEEQQIFAQAADTADLVKVSTPNYVSSLTEFKPKLGVFTYEAAWEGIPAADMDVEVSTDGLHYFINVSAKTFSAIDIFYKLRYEANGVLSAQDFLPIKATFDQKENSRTKLTEISFKDSGEVRSYRRKDDKDPEVLEFNPENFMLDPFSAAFLARALPWNINETKNFDVFNGKSRYLISLTAEEIVKMEVNGQLTDVWVISPKVNNLTSQKANKKLREAKIYVTADANRDILKIASSVFIGEVTTTLTAFTPAGPASGTAMARTQQNVFLK